MNRLFCIIVFCTIYLWSTTNGIGQELFFLNNTSLEEETIQPTYDFDYIPDFTFAEVEERIQSMKSEMPFQLNDRIFSFINYFVVRNRDYTKMMLQRKDIFFPMFEEILAAHDMPDDIKYLSIIESGLNPRARSRVGAMGLWQFMPATGKMYSLHYNQDIDDRMDPELSTEAAAKYLKSLYRMFGDWELALAAYNCGPGNVRKAIRRSGGKNTFWEIYNYLPRETRGYVPQFQAMMYIFNFPEAHNLVLENPTYPIAYEKVSFGQETDLEELASLLDICIEDLEFLNPSLQNRLIPSSHSHLSLRVPQTKADLIVENKEMYAEAVKLTEERKIALQKSNNNFRATPVSQPIPSGERVAYKVRSGDVLGTIAQRHGVSVTQLKSWNNLSSNMIRVGQTLYIYGKQVSPVNNNIAENINTNTSNQKYYTVQPGDSLWLISKKLNGISVEQLKRLNNLNSNQIKPGQKLIIG
jgi:membrane-bound lytic murein transglycosylase D